LVDLYRDEVDGLSFDYLKPQESGNRTDVRRLSLSDGGSALVFRGEGGRFIDFSAGYASREEVARSPHAHEIQKGENIKLNIDGGQRGVGGSIPGVLNLLTQYRMRSFRKYSLLYSLRRETPGETPVK
jgi:hypothetical protein